MDKKSEAGKNFRLLLIANFFQTFVFWYAIEKLFLLSINLTNFEIGLLVALTSATVLFFEFPSGVLADRWSRKGTLILATVALALADVLGFFSQGIFTYGLQVFCWGIFYALQSGVYSSLTYDMLLENKLPESEYDKYYGKIRITEGVALIISSVLGGILGEVYGLRSAYILSLPAAIISILIFLKVKEPKLHKLDSDQLSAWQHVTGALKHIKNSNFLILTMLGLVITNLIFTLGFEFSQLYYVAIGLPVVFFGLGNAAITGSFTFGGFLAHRLINKEGRPFIFLLILGVVVAFLQFVIRVNWGFLLPSILLTIFIAMEVRFGRIMHKQLPSRYRASVASLASTFGRLFAIPLSLLFGWIVGAQNYFEASLITTGVAAIALIVGAIVLVNPKINTDP